MSYDENNDYPSGEIPLISSVKSHLTSRLELLLTVSRNVDQPAWAISFEEIQELLLNLGSILTQVEIDKRLNKDVFEDPLNRGDALGNVLMISKLKHRHEERIFEPLGEAILGLVHDAADLHQRQQRQGELIEALTYSLGEFDDTETEKILTAKTKVAALRKDNDRLERRNQALWARNEELTTRHLKDCDRINRLSDQVASLTTFAFDSIVKMTEDLGLRSGFNVKTNRNRSRNAVPNVKNNESQKDGLQW